jgi:hypothetical protein
MKYKTIPLGVTKAKGLCFHCRKTTVFHRLAFNYFPDRSHLYASGYCEECGNLKCNLDVWVDDIVEIKEEAK